ncbi:hypothetical protein [Herbaspirillum sp.]|uniref:phosphorylase family protein n=1 Tax=Herbaspirillum sp. TaxID=1890675 RepID=UPI001B04A4BD|nr:hypothetical protein [Herbaspirillum sp.]MBO9537348.1 hypothetical protein [Herbaspirillum sp.]
MKVLILEDERGKAGRIEGVIRDASSVDLEIIKSSSVLEASTQLEETTFDLLILDVRVPMRPDQDPDDAGGIALLDSLQAESSLKTPRYIVGVSGVERLFESAARRFHRQGWVLLSYSPTSTEWADSLSYFVTHVSELKKAEEHRTESADVVILTALNSPEFDAVRKVFPELKGPRPLDSKTLCWEGEIHTSAGKVRVAAGYSWQMGLTAAAILASKFLKQYEPRLIAMVGICAGYEKEVALGDVIVATQSWEWQGGKIVEGEHGAELSASPEPFRASQKTLADLRILASDSQFSVPYTREYFPQDIEGKWALHFGPMVSGLSVVASAQTMGEIRKQHRKVLSLDMEAYAIYAASELNELDSQSIVIKGVCDFGNSHKGDDFQRVSAMRSAMVMRALLEKCPRNFVKNK